MPRIHQNAAGLDSVLCYRLSLFQTSLGRADITVKIEALNEHEQLAFAGLIRLIVRSDGSFTGPEAKMLGQIAASVGSQLFWKLMRTAQEKLETADDVFMQVAYVTRPEIRLWIYTVLHEIAQCDGVDRREDEVLEWLISTWDLR
ncbi:MAG: hypothetical protein AAF355_06640 [Myxococcota bacterium]